MYRAINFLILLACLSILILPSTAQDELNSIFAEDTCAPPCWFGLIPGESRAEDVEQFIADYEITDVEVYGLVDEETQVLITGVYWLTFLEKETSIISVEVQIRNFLVYSIIVHPTAPTNILGETANPDEYITLQQTLVQFGQPDHIYFYRGGFLYSDTIHATFIYTELQLRVEFNNPLNACMLLSIGDDMLIDTLTYYSREAANDLSSYVGHDEQQPALTALKLGEIIVVSEVWEQAINGQLDEACWHIPLFADDTMTAPIIYEEPDVPRSLFEDDTCVPPCWFGLVPGESTSEDVNTFTQNANAILRNWYIDNNTESAFDSETGYMLTGSYRSVWVLFEREDIANLGILLEVSEETLIEIRSNMNRVVLLHEVLERLGTPDYITIGNFDFIGTRLTFSYFDLRIHVYFMSIWQCNIGRMSNNFWVDRIHYYAPMSEQQAQINIGYGMTEVPIETWQSWLNGDVESSCSYVWQNLIEAGD